MKKYLLFIVCIFLCSSLCCSDSSKSSSSGKSIAIKGAFSGAKGAKLSLFDRIVSFIIPSAYALDVSDVKTVIVFNTDGSFSAADVTNGSFSVNATASKPVGIVFAGSGNSYLGYLTFSNFSSNINSLPLQQAGSDITEIDLGTLTSTGAVVESSNNPFGSAIDLTADEQDMYAQLNSTFAATIITPDVDGNGQVDLLENKFINLHIAYHYSAGSFSGSSLTPAVSSVSGLCWNLVLCAADGGSNGGTALYNWTTSSVLFTGPGMSTGLNNSSLSNDSKNWGSENVSTSCPTEGTYTISDGGVNTLTFYITSQTDPLKNLILIVPTVTLNSDNNTMNKISWIFKTMDNSAVISDPFKFIQGVKIQMNGTGTACTTPECTGQIYSSGGNPSQWITELEHTFTCQNIIWTNVTTINMVYWDIFGNQYECGYSVSH